MVESDRKKLFAPLSVSLLGYQGCSPLGLIDSDLMELGMVEWVGREVCCKDLEVPMRVVFF